MLSISPRSNEWTPSYQLGKEGPTPSPRALWLGVATLPWMDRIDWSIVLLKFNELEMTRIAIGLRLWLRRAIKRINDRTTARIVDMVNWNSLRALYPPIRIVELD